MNEKFSLIHTGGPYGDTISTYDGHPTEPLTVREFIDAVFKQYPNEWGNIKIWPTNHHIEYSRSEITQASVHLEDCLDRKIKSFTARGGWSRMDYTLIVETNN